MKTPADPPVFRIDPETLDFPLPDHLIAQEPVAERDSARLMVLRRSTGTMEHRYFSDLPEFLAPGDTLVINIARVNHAKLIGRKPTGGRVEVIVLGPDGRKDHWRALVRPRLSIGTEFQLASVSAVLRERTEEGENIVEIPGEPLNRLMETEGRVPLPPYIKRDVDDRRHQQDARDYQTVYGSVPGSVAAPTAGLHFSEPLLEKLRSNGVDVVPVVLHVGWGTFRPISTGVAAHRMLAESYELAEESVRRLLRARADGRRIIAVGTTSTRVLESLPENVASAGARGETSLFVRPGHQFRWIDGLITNFHVPRSTPIAMASAFAGMEPLEKAYREAVRERYRFFSYGDAMLIL